MTTVLERVRARQDVTSRAGAAVRVLQMVDDPNAAAGLCMILDFSRLARCNHPPQ